MILVLINYNNIDLKINIIINKLIRYLLEIIIKIKYEQI